MLGLNNKTRDERMAEIIRELLSLQERDKAQKKKRGRNWQYGILVVYALRKLDGGSLVIRSTDLGVLVNMGNSDPWVLFNKGKVKGGPKITAKECPNGETVATTRGSTKWLETMINKQMECMTKWKI